MDFEDDPTDYESQPMDLGGESPPYPNPNEVTRLDACPPPSNDFTGFMTGILISFLVVIALAVFLSLVGASL